MRVSTPRPAAASRSAASRSAALVFDGVNVIDVATGQVRERQRVVVAGSRIQAVGPADSVPWPAGARVVAGAKDRYLIPGLWDMHSHVQELEPIAYRLFIATGVTGIRDPGNDATPIAARRRWQREILAGRRVGPRLIMTGAVVSPRDPAAARHVVDSLKAAGADFVKNYLGGQTDPAIYFALAAEARRVGLRLEGHLPAGITGGVVQEGVSLEQASDSGQRIIDHEIGFGRCYKRPDIDTVTLEGCRALAEHLRRNGTWLVPTLGVGGRLTPRQYMPIEGRPEFEYSGVEADRIPGNALALAQQAELPLLAGTDRQPFGFKLHDELAVLVREGLSPLAALQAATLNPAKAYNATDSLGTVAAGKLADLVLLHDNPLIDIGNTTHILAVVANGRYFDAAALHRLLAEAARVADQCPSKRSPPLKGGYDHPFCTP